MLNTTTLLFALAGLIAGPVVNWAIYALAFWPRAISPWSTPPADASPRKPVDRLPIIGWLSLRRESSIHGGGYWIRPMLIELLLPVVLAGLYLWYANGFLLPDFLRFGKPLADTQPWMLALAAFHAVMLLLMVVATFIDFDEQTIPDAITVPGTLLAIVAITLTAHARLPQYGIAGQPFLTPVNYASPSEPDSVWLGWQGAALSMAIYLGWCFALAHRRWIGRKGFNKGVAFFVAGMFRHTAWKLLIAIAITGIAWIGWVWTRDVPQKQALLTALVGLSVGGGLVWSVRLMAAVALQKEAMGFGDVTLMAMIGATIGWQGSVIAFFFAPLCALAIVLVQFIVSGNRATPFGPYLCAGTLVTVACWDKVWSQWMLPVFELGPIIPSILLVALVMLGGMLWLWRLVESKIGGY
jgi:leader peptidase (prepilin peptidase) / N-methyltransferase